MTDSSRLDQIERVFHQVRGLPASEREERLRAECAGDDELRSQVEQLLSFHNEEELANEPTTPGDPINPMQMPERIGPFRILRVLGEGGMGVVYLAEQTEPIRRRVALKVIKLGMDTKALLSRFEKERQTLAIMQHDGIAKVYDCGATERGQPFISMEWVKGDALTTYCESRSLSLRDRIALIQQVCSAVQHAHQKGVVHRDLTPRNVLVSDDGGDPRIKIIDFGLAKAMGPSIGAESLVSDLQVVLGTPGYMAPEQANPTNEDIDTRADIYSIGVMLHELLIGVLPFENLHESGIYEMQRTLRETTPPRPSTRIGSDAGMRAHIATITGSTQPALLRALRQDLDWVVLKAIEPDPDRRYSSANELAVDLRHFLADEPISTGPPSVRYRLSKTLRRHRSALVGVAAIVLALAIGLVVAMWQAGVASDAVSRHETLRHLILLRQGFQKEAELVEHESNVKRMRDWLGKAQETRAMLGEYRDELARIETKGRQQEGGFTFDDLADEFEYDVYRSLVTMLEDVGPTALKRVKDSLQWVGMVENVTVTQQEDAWLKAKAAIQSDPRFHGLVLESQVGLVPIGADKQSGLQEFWMPRTGAPPTRGADGAVVVKQDTGVVFVLLPGGTFQMGSAPGKNEKYSLSNERPQHEVTLDPFFMAKHEFTQSQWSQLWFAGENPSKHQKPGRGHQPVERVSYGQAVQHLRRHRLLLPTEAQWEYACRAEKATRWYFGDTRKDLVHRINALSDGLPGSDYWADSKDGWTMHAVVGLDPAVGATHHFKPNGFGLFHMHGNVSELTRGLAVSSYENVQHAPADGEVIDGIIPRGAENDTVLRGGAFNKTVEDTRSAVRSIAGRHAEWDNVGFRASRPIYE